MRFTVLGLLFCLFVGCAHKQASNQYEFDFHGFYDKASQEFKAFKSKEQIKQAIEDEKGNYKSLSHANKVHLYTTFSQSHYEQFQDLKEEYLIQRFKFEMLKLENEILSGR